MCGIAGLVSTEGISEDDRRSVDPMLDALTHRGPDGGGVWADDHAVLGSRRLAIIDPERGQQPIANEDRTVWCVVNGEIYNHRALRAQLQARGHRFRTHSDSETVVHLYEECGSTCVEQLRGIFALAVWDARNRTLLLARDPVGVKPLYYARVGSRLVFASQLDALLAGGAVKPTVHPPSVHNYLVYHYVPSPDTILRGVSKLAPAERLIVRGPSQRSETYWNPSFRSDDGRADGDWRDAVRVAFESAVRANLVADVPLGAFLSSGLDSSAVVAAMSNAAGDRVPTFTVGFDQGDYDEREDARRFAGRCNTVHHDDRVIPDARDIVDALSGAFDEPFGDPSAVPTYYVSRLASGHVKTVLSGDGGDELFAGYTRYTRHHRERIFRRFARMPGTRRVIRFCAHGGPRRLQSAARQITADDDRAHYRGVAWFDPDETRAMLAPDFAHAMRHHDPFDVLHRHVQRCDSQDDLARSQYVDLKTWLGDGVLCKTDRASMANSLEVRVPLLDPALIELAAALPRRLKIRNGQGKHVFRQAMAPMLGADVVGRRKRGFEVPLDAWFGGPLRSFARDALSARDTRLTQWVAPGAIDATWRQLERGRRGIGARLWAMLMLELWARRHLIAPARSSHPAASPQLAGSAA